MSLDDILNKGNPTDMVQNQLNRMRELAAQANDETGVPKINTGLRINSNSTGPVEKVSVPDQLSISDIQNDIMATLNRMKNPEPLKLDIGFSNLTNAKYKVRHFSDKTGGCNYYRHETPKKFLNRDRAKWLNETVYSPEPMDINSFGDKDEYRKVIKLKYDLVVLHRLAGEDLLRIAAAIGKDGLGIPIIYEIDDLMHNVHRSSSVYEKYNPGTQRKFLESMTDFMRYADAMTVTTEGMRSFYSRYNPNCYVIPNCLDFEDVWTDYRYNLAKAEHKKNFEEGRCVIGWFGSDTHYDDFKQIVPALEEIARRFPFVYFLFGGWNMVYKGENLLRRLPLNRIIYAPWIKNPGEYAEKIGKIDLGLAPLIDTPFNRCKSNIKVLEYFAAGVPVVASKLPPYENDIQEGENGFLVKASGSVADRWVRKISNMCVAHELRLQMGKNARNYVKKRYNAAVWADRWAEVYEETINIARAQGREKEITVKSLLEKANKKEGQK